MIVMTETMMNHKSDDDNDVDDDHDDDIDNDDLS